MLDRLDCAALGFYDTGNSPHFVRGQLTRRHHPSYCPERVSHISRRLDCRQIEHDGPALAEWHEPLDTEPHGSRIAILRSRDNGVYDPVPVVFENLSASSVDLWREPLWLPAGLPLAPF